MAYGRDDGLIQIYNGVSWVSEFQHPSGLAVCALALLQNGYLASGALDASIKIWDTADGSLKKSISVPNDQILALAVLQNGYLASGGTDRSVNIWDTASGYSMKKMSYSGMIYALAVLPNGNIAVGGDSASIYVFDASTGAFVGMPAGVSCAAYSFAVLKNGLLASGCITGRIFLSYSSDLSYFADISAHSGKVTAILALKDGNFFSASADKKMNKWNVNDASRISTTNINLYLYSLALLQNDYIGIGTESSVLIYN